MPVPSRIGMMRARSDGLLPSVAAIYRTSSVSDGAGGQVDAWGLVSGQDRLPCRYTRSQEPSETETPLGIRSVSRWIFAFSTTLAPQEIRASDRIVVDGRTFEVEGVGGGSVEVARRVTAVEIAAG
jgi:hypothetical protein